MEIDLASLTEEIQHEIPISRALGIRCTEFRNHTLTLCAPLDLNLNHKCTAFGGSLYSVAVTCGWALVNIGLRQHKLQAQVVIQHAEMRYARPVDQDFCAQATMSSRLLDPGFYRRLTRHGMAATRENVTIGDASNPAAELSGKYVVILTNTD